MIHDYHEDGYAKAWLHFSHLYTNPSSNFKLTNPRYQFKDGVLFPFPLNRKMMKMMARKI